MVITLKNQTGNTLNYVGSAVSVGANASLVVTPDYYVALFQDATLMSDYIAGNVVINDGVSDYNNADGMPFVDKFFPFLFTPSATIPFYYSAPVGIRQSNNTGSGATVWAMRNPVGSAKVVFVESINLLMGFDAGTPLGRSFQKYDLVRFSAATPTAGSAITVVAMDSAAAASVVTDVRFVDTGLTTTSVSFGTAFATIGCPASDGSTNFYSRQGVALRLAAGEGLCIRLNGAAVQGQDLAGEIVWSER